MITRSNKKGIYVAIAVALIVCIVALMLIVFIPRSQEIKYEIVYDGVGGSGIIFRNEKFVELSSYEKVLFNNIVEGQYVTAGTNIVSAYKKGYIKATLTKLIETEKSIVTYQNQNIITGFDDKQIQTYDFEIDVTIKKMSEENGGYIELYGVLCHLMSDRQNYIRNTYNTESNEYLQSLYADELTMAESLAVWCDEINAENDGFIGFYCDGAESELTPERAQEINYKDFDSLMKNDYSSELNGFKLVQDNTWYVVLKVDDPSLFQIGNYYPVFINNEVQNEAGLLEQIIEDNKGSILVFSFTDNVEKYLDIRITDIFIGQRFEGFSVDSSYIKNGEVTIKVNKVKQNIPVTVLYEDNDIAVFEVPDNLMVGQKVYK